GAGVSGLISRSIGGRGRGRIEGRVATAAVAVALILLPFSLSNITIAYGQQMLALIVIFVSILGLTASSSHTTPAQSGVAGRGPAEPLRPLPERRQGLLLLRAGLRGPGDGAGPQAAPGTAGAHPGRHARLGDSRPLRRHRPARLQPVRLRSPRLHRRHRWGPA